MPEIAIKIGPKTYPVRCGEGEQERIAALGALIAEHYDRLGNARAPLESHNLVFTALFMADELTEARATAEAAQAEIDAARSALETALARVEQERARGGAKREEYSAELETLRKSEARAREDVARLKEELAELRETHAGQHDLFGTPAETDKLADALETLADKIEASVDAMEDDAMAVGAMTAGVIADIAVDTHAMETGVPPIAGSSPPLEDTADKD